MKPVIFLENNNGITCKIKSALETHGYTATFDTSINHIRAALKAGRMPIIIAHRPTFKIAKLDKDAAAKCLIFYWNTASELVESCTELEKFLGIEFSTWLHQYLILLTEGLPELVQSLNTEEIRDLLFSAGMCRLEEELRAKEIYQRTKADENGIYWVESSPNTEREALFFQFFCCEKPTNLVLYLDAPGANFFIYYEETGKTELLLKRLQKEGIEAESGSFLNIPYVRAFQIEENFEKAISLIKEVNTPEEPLPQCTCGC